MLYVPFLYNDQCSVIMQTEMEGRPWEQSHPPPAESAFVELACQGGSLGTYKLLGEDRQKKPNGKGDITDIIKEV